MNRLLAFSRASEAQAGADFWQRILSDHALSDCGDLEKLLVGCEIIAALDGIDSVRRRLRHNQPGQSATASKIRAEAEVSTT